MTDGHHDGISVLKKRFRGLLDSAPDAMVVTDPEGRILLVNAETEKLFGFSREELEGQPVEMLIPPRFRAKHPGHRVEFVGEGRVRRMAAGVDLFGLRKDGSEFPADISLCPVETPEGTIVSSAIRDVSDQKDSERRLKELLETARREAREQYRLLFEKSPHPMWVVDRDTFRFLEVNESAIRQYGYSREEFLAMQILDLRPPEDVAATLDAISNIGVDPRKHGLWRNRRKDGSLTWVEVTTHALVFEGRSAWLTLSYDVTDRLRAEEALRASEERYRALIEQAQDAIFVNDLDGTVQEVNSAAERLVERSRGALVGHSFLESLPPEDRERVWRSFTQALERGRRLELLPVRIQRPDGMIVPAEVTASVVQFGGKSHVVGLFRDVSERNALSEQLRLAQKMEAIGQLAGGVAHDFNNLLTAILGYSQLLAPDLRGNPEHFAAIDEIRKAGERAAGLTRQLLAFSRRQMLEPKVLDLNEVIRHIQEMLSRLIGEDIRVSIKLDRALGSVRADAGQIEQVIMNLAVNARDAMPQGGQLSIETANVDLDEAYAQTHVHLEPGPYAMLAVSDTGFGMDEETRNRIFEPFYTTKEKGHGTGLGLSTVYGIVKQSGGYIWVYSELGKGTTFKVYLPRVSAPAEPLGTPEPVLVPAIGHETILLVEDEESVRALASKTLGARGYRVLEAADGGAALEIARSQAVDLLLTDMVLPFMGGSAIAAAIREIHPQAKVLFTSGYTDDVIVRRGLMEQGAAFLEKPFTPNVLARKVREVLDG
jgi:two-component system, cell cycle sensor histidine kinase and response regulator CckA